MNTNAYQKAKVAALIEQKTQIYDSVEIIITNEYKYHAAKIK